VAETTVVCFEGFASRRFLLLLVEHTMVGFVKDLSEKLFSPFYPMQLFIHIAEC